MPALFRRFCVVLLALACAAALADAPPDAKEIARLIEQLGDDDVEVRRAAEDKLKEIGEPALALLREAGKSHADADVRLRAAVLARSLLGEIRRFTGHTGHVRSLAVSKDGKRALSGSMDGTARLWDVATGKELLRFVGHLNAPARTGQWKGVKWVWSVAFSPDEKRAISSGALDRALRLWRVEDGKEVRQFLGHKAWVYAAAFSPDGKYVLSSGAGNEVRDDYTVRLWDVESGKELRKFEGHTGYVWRAIFSPDGKKIASAGCNDRSFRIWDAATGKPLVIGARAHDGNVVGIAFSPDGKHLLTSGNDLTCKLWEVETGKLLRTYTGAGDHVEAVAFSPDGKRFLAGEKNAVHVFDAETGKSVHRFEEHTGRVFAVAWLPGGARALSGGEDNVVRLWRVPK
jgi:WD40 repeat protein